MYGSTRRGLALAVLAAGIIIAVGPGIAQAATTYKLTGTGSTKAGSKKAPAPFNGSFILNADGGPGMRAASPVSWQWAWEGVVIDGTGLPTCTAAQIDAAQSPSVCPKGSLVGRGDNLTAQIGPVGDPFNSVDCLGKHFEYFNAGPKEIAILVTGPGDQCAGVTYTAPTTINLSTKGNTTTATLNWPLNFTQPLPGVEATLNNGGGIFPLLKKTVKKGKKKVKSAYMTSVGCKGPTRSFTFTAVDTEGSTTQTSSAGKCVVPKKKKKKK